MWWLKGDSEEGGADEATGSGPPETSSGNDNQPIMLPDANTLSEMKDQFDQQQQLIHELKELVRENEQQLRHKENALQESAAKLSKLKLQHKAKMTQMSTQRRESSGSASALADNNQAEEDLGAAETSSATDSSRGRVLMLKRQLEENRAAFEKREKALNDNKRAIEQVLDNLKEQLEDREKQIDELKSTQEARMSAPDVKPYEPSDESKQSPENKQEDNYALQEMYAQIVYKDSRIMELNNHILQLEGSIMDLKENLTEKDGVIQARNKAIQLMSEDLSRRGKVVVDQLDDTRDEMRLMQHNFSTLENNWKAEETRLLDELTVVRDRLEKETLQHNSQIADLRNANANLDNARFDLSTRNAELQEKVVHLNEELQKTKAQASIPSPKDLQEKIKALSEEIQEKDSTIAKLEQEPKSSGQSQKGDDKNAMKMKAQQKSKIKALEAKIRELEREQSSSQDKIVVLEEEKGNLQLKLVDYDELFSSQAQNSAVTEELKEQLRKQSDELSSHVKMVSILQTEKLNLAQTLQSQQELHEKVADERQALEDAKVSLEMRLVEAEELKDVADAACLELRKEVELLATRLDNNKLPVLDVENRNDALQEKVTSMQLELEQLQTIIVSTEAAKMEAYSAFSQKNSELQESIANCTELEHSVTTLSTRLDETQTTLQAMQNEIENKSSELNDVRAVHASLEANYDDLKAKFIETESSREDAVAERMQLADEVDAARRALQSLKPGYDERLDQLEAQFAAKQQERDAEAATWMENKQHLDSLIEEKHSSIENLRAELSMANERNEKLEAAIAEKESAIASLSSTNAQKDLEVQYLSEKKDHSDKRLEEKVTSLVSQLSELEAEVGSLQQQLEDEKARAERLASERTNAIEEEHKVTASLQEMNDWYKNELQAHKESNEHLQNELHSKIQELTIRDSEREIAEKNLVDLRRTVEEQDFTINELIAREKDQAIQVNEGKAKLSTAENQIQELSSQLEASQQLAAQSVNECHGLRSSHEAESAIWKNERQELETSVCNMKQAIEELTATNLNQTTEMASIQDALKTAEAVGHEFERMLAEDSSIRISREQQSEEKQRSYLQEIERLKKSVGELSLAIKSQSETSPEAIGTESELKEAIEKLEQVQAENDTLQSSLAREQEDKDNRLKVYEEQLRCVNEHLQDFESVTRERNELQTILQESVSERQALELKVIQLENELIMLATRDAESGKTLENARKDSSNMADILNAERHAHLADIQEMETKRAALLERNDQLEGNNVLLRNSADQLQALLNEAADRVGVLENENARLAESAQRMESDFASALEKEQLEFQKLANDLASLVHTGNAMEEQLNEAKQHGATLSQKLDEEQERCTTLERDCRELNDAKRQAEAQLDSKISDLQNKSKENNDLCDSYQKLEEELELCRGRCHSLETSVSALSEERLQMSTRISELSNQMGTLHATGEQVISNLNEELQKSTRELSEKEERIATIERNLREAASKVSEMERLEDELRRSEEKCQQLEAYFKEAVSLENSNVSQNDDDIERESQSLGSELHEMSSWREKFDSAQQKTRFLEAELEELGRALKEVTCRTDHDAQSEKTLRSQVEQELADARAALDISRNETQEVQALLSASERKLAESEAMEKDLGEEKHKLQEKILTLNESRSKVQEGVQTTSAVATSSESPDVQQQLRNQLAVFKIKNEKMLKKLKQFKDNNDKLQLQINDLMSTQVNLEDGNVRYRELNDRANEDIRRLTFDLRNVDTLRKADAKSFHDRLDTLEVANAKLIDIKEDLENELTSSEKEHQKAKESVQEAMSHLRNDHDSYKNHQREMTEQLQNKNASLARQLESLNKHNEFLESDNREFQQIIANNQADRSTFEQEIRNQSEKYVQLLQENAKLKEHCELDSQAQDLSDKYAALTHQFEDLRNIRMQLEADVDRLTTELNETVLQRSQLECEIKQLTTTFEERLGRDDGQLENVKLFNHELTQKNQEVTQHNREVTQHNQELTQHNRELTQHNQELTQKNQELQEEMSRTVTSRETLLESEKAEHFRRVTYLEDEISRLNHEVRRLTDVVSSTEAQTSGNMEALLSERQELMRSLSDRTTVAERLQAEVQRLQAEQMFICEEQRNAIQALENRIREEVTRGATRALEDELYRVKDDLGKGMLQLKDEMEKAALFEQENEHLKSRLEDLRNRSDKNEAEVLSYKAEISNLQDENAAMEQQLANWKKHLGSVVTDTQQTTESKSARPTSALDADASLQAVLTAQDASREPQQPTDNQGFGSRLQSLEAELQHAMQSLHLRNLRCEEFSNAIQKLIEERDSLQLRLSSSIRSDQQREMKIEMLQRELAAKSETSNETEYESIGLSSQTLEEKYKEVLQLNAVLEQALITEKENRLKSMADLKMANEELFAAGSRTVCNDETRISLSDDASPLVPEHSQTLIRSYTGAAWRIANWIQGRRRYFYRTLRNGPSTQLAFYAYFLFVHLILFFMLI